MFLYALLIQSGRFLLMWVLFSVYFKMKYIFTNMFSLCLESEISLLNCWVDIMKVIFCSIVLYVYVSVECLVLAKMVYSMYVCKILLLLLL